MNNNLRGIVMMLIATVLLTAMDGLLKALSEYYPPLQVAALRGLVSLPFIFAWAYWRDPTLQTLVAVRWHWQLARGLLGIVMLTSFIFAINSMPLSEAYALFFIAPILITALSVPFLRESVGRRRWTAVAIGFVGMLVILRPGINTVSIASLAVLLTALCYSLNAISVRILGRTDSTAAMAFWFVVVLSLGAGLLALPNWHSVDPAHIGLLIGLGATGAAGQLCITSAFRNAPASVIAPFEYTALIWGVLLDLTIWGKVPAPMVFVGAGIIVMSGLYLIGRERALTAKQ